MVASQTLPQGLAALAAGRVVSYSGRGFAAGRAVSVLGRRPSKAPPSVQEITVGVQSPLDSKVLELMQMHVRAQDGRGPHVSPSDRRSSVVVVRTQSVL